MEKEYKGWKIKKSMHNWYYATSEISSKSFVGNTIKEIQEKINRHLENMKKATPSKMFPNLVKELNKEVSN